MNTSQLQCVIDCDPEMKKHISGVYAANELPHIIWKPSNGFIANTDPIYSPGQHWIAFYFNENGFMEFFDSYGNSPEQFSPYFKQYMGNYPSIKVNKKRLQSNDTIVCGQYCLFYLMCRTRGYSMHQIVDFFNSDFHLNDQFVYHFIDERFYCCVSSVRNNHQKCVCEK